MEWRMQRTCLWPYCGMCLSSEMDSVRVFCREAAPEALYTVFRRWMWFLELPDNSDKDSANPFRVNITPKLDMGF